jgi:hypothetical protein
VPTEAFANRSRTCGLTRFTANRSRPAFYLTTKSIFKKCNQLIQLNQLAAVLICNLMLLHKIYELNNENFPESIFLPKLTVLFHPKQIKDQV